MIKRLIPLVVILASMANSAHAYIEAFHPLGRICKESTTITIVEVARANTDKNLVIYRKVRDLKGKHPDAEIKQNIGQRGFHAREWQNIMAWVKEGKQAIFFHNGNASVTAIDNYWYQCFREGEWWAMTHAEPFLMRSYYGSVERLLPAITDILAGKEVVVPAFIDGPKEPIHLRQGKIHRIRASLTIQDYNAKRDFVGLGDDATAGVAQAKPDPKPTAPNVPSVPSYRRFININGPARVIDGQTWEPGNSPHVTIVGTPFENRNVPLIPPTDETRTKMIRACVHGQGCGITVKNIPNGLYDVYLHTWEDNEPVRFDVLVNGRPVLRDHNSGKAGQWARLGPWTTSVTDGTIAVINGSSTPANFSGLEILPAAPKKPAPPIIAEKLPADVIVDKSARHISLPGVVAPRKLAHLSDVYPIEVIATYPDGQKAHETVITFKGVKPSQLHAALESLGLKPGQPVRGQGTKPTGPQLRLALEIPDKPNQPRRIPIEQALVDMRTNKPLATPITWHFTGSNLRQIDPESDAKTYGADITGTLITVFPVTDDTVIQSSFSSKDEVSLKLEINREILPKEGSPIRLIIEAK